MLIPKTIIQDLGSYISFSQNIQRRLNKKEYYDINELLLTINISDENQFLITEVLRQTFPHKNKLSNWERTYENSKEKLNISEIKSFQSKE